MSPEKILLRHVWIFPQLRESLFKLRYPVGLFGDFLIHFSAKDGADVGVENLLVIGRAPCYVPPLVGS